MKMYSWASERFAEYTEGYITTVAKDVESARKKVIEAYKKDYVIVSDYDKVREKQFLKDIACEPCEDSVTFTYGGA